MEEDKKEGSKDPLRKSCDYCARMKRACDGLDPCELCLRRRKECTRSVKRKSGPAKGAKYAPRRNKREVKSSQAGSQASGMNKQDKWRDKRHAARAGVREEDAERRVAPNSGFATSAGSRGCSDGELPLGAQAARGDYSTSVRKENGETSGGNGEPGVDPGRKGDLDGGTTRGGGTQPATADASTLSSSSSSSSSSPPAPSSSGQSGASTENDERVTGCHPGVSKEDHSSEVSGEPLKRFSGSESSASRSDLPSSAMELDSGRVEVPANHPRKATKQRASGMSDSEAVRSRGSDSSLVERNESFGDRAPGGVGNMKHGDDGNEEVWATRSSSNSVLAEGDRGADGYSGRVKTAPSSPTFLFAGSSRASNKPQAWDGRSQALSRLSSERNLQSRDDADGIGSGKSEDPSGRDGGWRKAPSRDENPLQSEESSRFASRKRDDIASEETSGSPRCAGSESEGAPPSDARQERFWGIFAAPHTSRHGSGERCSSSPTMKQEESGLPPLNDFWDRSTAAGKRADEIDRYVRRSIGHSVFQRNFSAPVPLPPKDLLRMLRPNDHDVIDAIAERSGSVSDGESRGTLRALPRISSAPERSDRATGLTSDGCGGKLTDKPPSSVTGGGGCLVRPSVDLLGRGSAVKKEVDDRSEKEKNWMPVNEAEARYWRELWDCPPGELGLPLGSGLRGVGGVGASGDGRHGSAPNESVERDFRGSRIAREVLKRGGQRWGDRDRCGNKGGMVGDEKGGRGLGKHSSSPDDGGVPADNGTKHLWDCKEEQAAGSEAEDSHRRLVGGAEACLRQEESARGPRRPERVSLGRETGFDAGGDTRNGGTRQVQEESFRGRGEVAVREREDGDGGTIRREGDMGNSTAEQVVERDGDPPFLGKKSHGSNRPYKGGVVADIMELCGDRAGSARDFRRDAAEKKQNSCTPSENEAGKNKATGDVRNKDGSARHGSKCDGDGMDREGNSNSNGHFFREGVTGVIIENSQNAEYRGVNRINSTSSAASSVASSCNSIQGYDPSRAERNDTIKSVAETRGGSDHDRDFFRSRLISRGGVGMIGSPPTQVQGRPGPELLACLRSGRDPGVSMRYHEPYRRPPKVEEETATPPRPGPQHVERAATIPCKAEPPESWSRRSCASVFIPGGVSMSSPWPSKSSWFPTDDRGRSRFPVEVEDDYGNGQPSSSLQIIRGGVTDGSGKGDQGFGWVRGQGSVPSSRCNVPAVGERDPRRSVDDGAEGVRAWEKEGQGDVWNNGRWRPDWGPLSRGVRNGEFCKQGVSRLTIGRRVEEED